MSSANKIGLDLSDTLLERSLIYIRNNNGPSTEPCGTPCCTSLSDIRGRRLVKTHLHGHGLLSVKRIPYT